MRLNLNKILTKEEYEAFLGEEHHLWYSLQSETNRINQDDRLKEIHYVRQDGKIILVSFVTQEKEHGEDYSGLTDKEYLGVGKWYSIR